ncbi:hypothetical protein [Kineococcus sp. SYSU DK003]|uniref:hypothetical protein n=1 Tax=Kineococcus sp. SYSU DK003 TaxID=3383124 RepID=UPI003D7D2BC3
MPRIDRRRALVVGVASLASLTLLPLLAEARPTERTILLLAAVPVAAAFGYLAGYAAAPIEDFSGTPTPTAAPRPRYSPPPPTSIPGKRTPPIDPVQAGPPPRPAPSLHYPRGDTYVSRIG